MFSGNPSPHIPPEDQSQTISHVVVVDDEEDILELVQYNLTKEGLQVHSASTGEEGLALIRSISPDIVILDLMLPGMSGLKVCETLRRDPTTKDLPVIILSAKGEESDIVAGLELGADDYITKPFSPSVLLARVRAVTRRKRASIVSPDESIRYGALIINPGKHEVQVGSTRIQLTFTEFRILHLLARRPGWVFTRYQIVDSVRGEDYAVTERAVDVQIVGLRRKLGTFGTLIETVRGVGYRFHESGSENPHHELEA